MCLACIPFRLCIPTPMLSVGQQPTTAVYNSSLLVQEGVSFCLGGILCFSWKKIENQQIVVYGNPTPSDLLFMDSALFSFPASKASSTLSSTVSDAESAPPELDLLFHEICDKRAELVLLSNKQWKPEWSIPELIQALMGNEAVQIPGYPQDIYYYILLRGATSWFFQDLCHFIDLINYPISIL
jgi:hypothetical protein